MTPTGPSPAWKYHAQCPLTSHQLVLTDGAIAEVVGASSAELNRSARSMPVDDWQKLRGTGLPLSAIELAVHRLVRSRLRHGAFAAAAVRLIPPRTFTWPCDQARRSNEDLLVAGSGRAVGQLHDRISGPPVVLLAESGELAECLLLTWHGQWRADRCVLRLDFIRRGEHPFGEAFNAHPREVAALLGDEATALLSNWSCAN